MIDMPTMKCSGCGTIFHIYAKPCPICAVEKGLRNHYDPRLSHLPNDLWKIYSSANKGDAKSANCLGKCYFTGSGIENDFDEAVFWFVKGAIGGNDSAIYHLGICFARGCGVEADPFFAYVCFAEAIARGNRSAKVALQKLKQEISVNDKFSNSIERRVDKDEKWQGEEQTKISGNSKIDKTECNLKKQCLMKPPINAEIKRKEDNKFIPGKTKLYFLDNTGTYQESTFHHFDCKDGQTVIYVAVGENLKYFGYPGCMGITLHRTVQKKYELKNATQEAGENAVKEAQRFPLAEFVSSDIEKENEKERKKLKAVCNEIDEEKDRVYYEAKNEAERIAPHAFEQLREAFVDARENGVDIYSSYGQVMRVEETVNKAKKVRDAADRRIHELDTIKRKPYFCRMDIGENRRTLHSVYVGLSDFKNVIVDWRNKTLGSIYQLSKFYANNANFCLALKRNIEIKEAITNGDNGIYQGFTDEINVYGTENENSFKITDPLFNRLLEENRLNVGIHNIVQSIQENQYKIITAPLGKNLVVNGCAGSGKTMILYHRLSFLLYNNRYLKPKDIFVITPNRLFNVLVKELLTELHLDEIVNLSKSDFWEFIIKQYSNEFFPGEKMVGNPLFCRYDDSAKNLYLSAVRDVCNKTELSGRFVQWEIQQIYSELKELATQKKVNFNPEQIVLKEENICKYSEKDLFMGGKCKQKKKQEELFQYYIKFKNKSSDPVVAMMSRIIARFQALQIFLKGNIDRIYIEICRYAVYSVNEKSKISLENTLDANAFIANMLAEKFGTKFKDGCLFIDEFQNYSVSELRWLKHIFPSEHICLFGDILQRIDKNGITDISQLQEVMPVQVFAINENYRNAKEITEFINDRLEMSMLPIGLHGKVTYVSAEDAKFEKEKQIAVIVKDESEWMILRKKNIALLQKQVAFSQHERKLSENINVFTVSEVKGLEFPIVYVYDCGMTKNEMYVAYTRALNELYIFN